MINYGKIRHIKKLIAKQGLQVGCSNMSLSLLHLVGTVFV